MNHYVAYRQDIPMPNCTRAIETTDIVYIVISVWFLSSVVQQGEDYYKESSLKKFRATSVDYQHNLAVIENLCIGNFLKTP
ncbi:hypothetical protein TURU_130151 [Turdus rufiventris]|nr:hypothetical protein TURU_130151 [Turdus rufiventris]